MYLGRYWVQPKHVYGKDLTGFTPLYLGPLLMTAPMDEVVLLLFPSIVTE